MKAKVFSNNNLLGFAELKVGDFHMGGLYGIFTPTDYYVENIQAFVWTFNETEKNNFADWDALNIQVQLENGLVLEAIGGIIINDFPEMFDELIEIEMAGVDTTIISDLFGTL